MSKGRIVYTFKDALYINLTNRCPAKCIYCIKYKCNYEFRGYNLRLEQEPEAEEVVKEIGNPAPYKEVVFCGYGEPLMRLEVLKKVARWLKERKKRVRINTIGYGNLIYGRNILPELENLIDAIWISLNAHTKEEYLRLYRPEFGEETFSAVLDFIKECKKYIPEVAITSIDFAHLDLNKCAELAQKLKVKFHIRPYLGEEI